MELNIECPVCEERFSSPDVPLGSLIVCPSCKREFERTSAVETDPTPTEQSTEAYSTRLAVPIASEFPQSNDQSIPTAIPQTQDVETDQASRLLDIRIRRRRRRLISTLVSSAVLAAIIGILGGLLVKQMKKNELLNSSKRAQQNKTLNQFDPGASDIAPTQGDDGHADLNPDDPEDIPEIRIAPEDIPRQKLEYWKRRQVKNQWKSVQPHLVSLKVFDRLGTHNAVGTIVDSRGWILTSYNSVRGASKIEVRSSVGAIDDYWDAKPLTDLVRGYVDVRKEDDLALLSINRRFIVAFTILELADRNLAVEGQYLLQCAPPSRRNLYGATETQIKNRGLFQQLDSVGQSWVSRNHLDGEELTWLVGSSHHQPDPGTPLFDTDGKLTAIASLSPQQQDQDRHSAYFLGVEKVADMIQNWDGEIKPLSEFGDGNDGGLVAAAVSSDMYEPSIRLNQLAELCREFDWIPKTETEYQTLQQLAASYAEIADYAKSKTGTTIAEERKIITQKEHLESVLNDRFAGLSHEDELLFVQANKQFASKSLLEGNQFVPFFGSVYFVDVVSSSLIINALGTDSFAKVPISPLGRPLRMQTKGLFFAKTPSSPRPINYRISGEELVTAETIESFLSFGVQ